MAEFSDIDFFLEKNEITNDIVFKTSRYAIAQSIENILLTKRGEGLFNPNFGSTLLEDLSYPRDSAELESLKYVFTSQIETQETRATIDKLTIEKLLDTYSVTVYFTEKINQQQGTVTLTTG